VTEDLDYVGIVFRVALALGVVAVATTAFFLRRVGWRFLVGTFRNGGLPLFQRELISLASKKRTYALRVVYAVILLFLGFSSLDNYLNRAESRGAGGLDMLGSGSALFESIFTYQMAAIHIFLPAMVCAAVTSEKERNTLGLLFVTRLGPWRILFEKLFSRSLPMVMCILLSLPMLGLCYTLGGLGVDFMLNGIWLLGITLLQVGSLALLCSTYCRTTVGAFISAYILQGVLVFLAVMLVPEMEISPWGSSREDRLIHQLRAVSGGAVWSVNSADPFWKISLLRCLPLYATTTLFMLLSRLFLFRRAWVPAKARLLSLFKLVDRFFVFLNDNLTAGVVLVKDVGSLPTNRPVAWREVTKKSLGTARYLFRVFLVLEFPTLFICIFMMGMAYGNGLGWVKAMVGLLWCVSALIVAMKASTLVASERSSETWDVLLTTPMSAKDILLQKCAGLRRVMVVVAVPLLSAIGFEAYMAGSLRNPFAALEYGLLAVGQVVVFLPLLGWVSIWIGLQFKSQTRSVFTTMLAISLWTIGGIVLFYSGGVFGSLSLLSPASGIVANETRGVYFNTLPVLIWLQLIGFGVVYAAVRILMIVYAENLLGRAARKVPESTETVQQPSANLLEHSHAAV